MIIRCRVRCILALVIQWQGLSYLEGFMGNRIGPPRDGFDHRVCHERKTFGVISMGAVVMDAPDDQIMDNKVPLNSSMDESANDPEEEEQELVFDFVQMVQLTPSGELDVDDVDLLRAIMGQMAKIGPRVVDGVDIAQMVEWLLHRLISEWQAAGKAGDEERVECFRPKMEDFDVAISAWVASENPDKVVRLLSILSDQRELYMADPESFRPNVSSINSILRALADSRGPGVDKRATQVFDSIEDYGITANSETYEQMVKIIARSRNHGAAERAEKLLRHGVNLFPPGLKNGKFVGITVEAFNAVVVAYAKSGRDDGPGKAQELIAYMDKVDTNSGGFGICSPNIKTFTTLIDASCQKNEWDSVCEAERMLNKILDQYLDGNEDLEPSIATWTIVISAWGRLSRKNRGGAADRAGRLLRRMQELHREGKTSYKPDAIAYVSTLTAYAHAKGGEDAGEAEKVLEEMYDLYLDGDDSMKPSPRSIRLIADAWIKSGDMQSAEQFLNDYEEYLYDGKELEEETEFTSSLFRSMIFGFSKQGNMEKAQHFLDLMLEKSLKPDNECFFRMIEGFSKADTTDSLKKALQVFELLERCRKRGSVEPNERVYSAFIRAITKGKARDMHQKAETLFRRMVKLHEEGNINIKPTIFTYNAVLNACAESIHVEGPSRDDAFKTAVKIFTELRNGRERPDHVTYGNMLRCALLLDEGPKRDKYISAVFHLCREQGCVNDFVLRDIQMVACEDLWRYLLNTSTGEPHVDLLPPDWTYISRSGKPASHIQDERRRGGYRQDERRKHQRGEFGHDRTRRGRRSDRG